jgi:hypothetical protein
VTERASLAATTKRAFHEELHPERQSAVISWLSFTGTFAGVRALTYSIRAGRGPFHDVTPKGLHLHHYLWGIVLVSGAGGIAVRGDERLRRHPLVATAYGLGLALIVDEFALLLDLKDVYWSRQGRWSVDLGIGIIAVAGALLEGAPVARRLAQDLRPRNLSPADGHRDPAR